MIRNKIAFIKFNHMWWVMQGLLWKSFYSFLFYKVIQFLLAKNVNSVFQCAKQNIRPTLCKAMMHFEEVQYVRMCAKYVLETYYTSHKLVYTWFSTYNYIQCPFQLLKKCWAFTNSCLQYVFFQKISPQSPSTFCIPFILSKLFSWGSRLYL